MRVLQIAKYMYPFLGGTEQVTRDLVGAFNANGAENKVICFNEDSTDGEITTRRHETVTDKVDGVDVIRVASKVKIMSQAIAPEYKKNLTKVLDEFKPDVVIFHYPNPYVASKLLSYIRKNGKSFKLYIYWNDFSSSLTGRCAPRSQRLPGGVLEYRVSPEVFDCIELR